MAASPTPLTVTARGGAEDAVVLIGNPNVGKSALFGALTGTYATVSNYPGTTVEVATGWTSLDGHRRRVVDTPGAASLLPASEDENTHIKEDSHENTESVQSCNP
jgi:ferrous iron transport protein B